MPRLIPPYHLSPAMIGFKLGVSGGLISKWFREGQFTIQPKIYDDHGPLWYWYDVSHWIETHPYHRPAFGLSIKEAAKLLKTNSAEVRKILDAPYPRRYVHAHSVRDECKARGLPFTYPEYPKPKQPPKRRRVPPVKGYRSLRARGYRGRGGSSKEN